jgi:hypothetical protein
MKRAGWSFISRNGTLISNGEAASGTDLLRKSHSNAAESADCQKNFIKSLCPPKISVFLDHNPFTSHFLNGNRGKSL